MQHRYADIESISDLHRFYGCGTPRHPLITVINLQEVNRSQIPDDGTLYRLGFYSIFCKQYKGSVKYGKSHYDFNEGSLMFTAPEQVMSPGKDIQMEEGWGIFFHPDLLRHSALGRKMQEYTFFHYDINEALHVSEEEKKMIDECKENIRREYQQNIDKHTQNLILSNLELLLNYCARFYDRQFFTRASTSNDTVQRFDTLLREYFAQDSLVESGLPEVKYFASRLNLSPNYLSDLLNRYTGKTTQEHIHLQLVDKAKNLLWGSEKSISEIAYELGFEHPSHFTKLFKSKTGRAPREFRQQQ